LFRVSTIDCKNPPLKDGDIDANVAVQPGDILIIPQSWF